MGRKSVAVLDIRSSEIAVIVGERGVNNTLVFRANKTVSYSGYEDGKFYDVEELKKKALQAVSAVEQIVGERIHELYVGVPGEFLEVFPKELSIGFPKRRKITKRERDLLKDSGREARENSRCIHDSSMIYITADNRRVVDPDGLVSTGLRGAISYSYCSEYFASTFEEMFKEWKVTLKFLPTPYAMGVYLIPSETRDEYAVFLDAGFLSSTVCVMLGNGVLMQSTGWVGRGQIVVRLMEKFSLPYEAALALLSRSNLYARTDAGSFEYFFRGETYDIDVNTFVETVKEGLDELCEFVGKFLDDCSGKELDFKPLYVSGEGLVDIRGALEHISKRLNRVCEQVVPHLPYYNKPSMSSGIALLDMAYEDHQSGGFLYRIMKGIGG